MCSQKDAFLQHVRRDGLASLLHAAEAALPGCRLHLLTYSAMGDEAARRVAADLAVWRPDIAFHCAESMPAAAEHIYRATRAVAEANYKQTASPWDEAAVPLRRPCRCAEEPQMWLNWHAPVQPRLQ